MQFAPESPYCAELLDTSLVGWPDQSAVALISVFDEPLRGRAAVISLPIPECPTSFEQMLDTILSGVTKVLLSLYPAWLPDADGIEGPGGAGLAAVVDLAQAVAPTD